MEWWLVLLLATSLAFVALLLAPFRVDLSLEARGEPNGFWAIAAGVQCGLFGVTGVAAHEVPASVQVRFAGRTLKTLRPERGSKRPLERAGRAVDRARQRFDLVALGEWIIEERKRVQIQRLDVELAYSFANVVLTGQLLAATSVLAGVLPAPIRLTSAPSWELVDKASLSLSGRIKIWPGRFLFDALRFVAKNRRVFKRRVES